jgi:hypothetical protein
MLGVDLMGWVAAEMSREENAPLVLRMVQESLARNKDAEWEGIYDRIVAGLAAKITSLIQGRSVLLFRDDSIRSCLSPRTDTLS